MAESPGLNVGGRREIGNEFFSASIQVAGLAFDAGAPYQEPHLILRPGSHGPNLQRPKNFCRRFWS